MEITIESLVADGWVRTIDPVFPMRKEVECRNPLSEDEDSKIKLVIHTMYNQETYALCLPDGGMLNLFIRSMEDLQEFESKLNYYDPPF